MRMAQPLTILLPLSVPCLLCGPALADNCTGYDVLVNRSAETTEVAKGHTLTATTDYSVVTSDDYPIVNGSTGQCSSTVLTFPDGKVKVSGHCARKDKDGDSYSLEFSAAPGANRTMWRVVAGTGKFASNTSSGWAQGVAQDGKMTMVKWGGTCK